jgi:uncharacterized protein YdcH (DUF465 family)
MGENMLSDASVQVLVERMNNYLDGQKRIEGQLAMLVQMQLSLASVQEQIKGLDSGQKRLFEKSDDVDARIEKLREDEIGPLHDEMIGNKRAVRVLGIVGSVVVALAGGFYSQWKPWQIDLQNAREARDAQLKQYSSDIGKELQSDDRRLTVLEFRANNVDGKTSK